MSSNAAFSYLQAHGVKPSVQRLAVMDYLLKHHTHPTAEEIQTALVRAIPTLAKGTVYNTLRLLVEKGAVMQLTIDERKTCYDAETKPHGHFLCRHCGHIFDVALTQEDLSGIACLPKDFEADSTELYVKGTCPHCKAGN